MKMRRAIGNFSATVMIVLAGADAAHAQQSAMRQACAADYQSLCSGVQPGGGRIIACLQENAAKVSPACQKALETAKAAHAETK